jgi:hypothetical protein
LKGSGALAIWGVDQTEPRGLTGTAMSTTETETAAPETRAFEADVARLLHLMVHAVYSCAN